MKSMSINKKLIPFHILKKKFKIFIWICRPPYFVSFCIFLVVSPLIYMILMAEPEDLGTTGFAMGFTIMSVLLSFSAPFCGCVAWVLFQIGFNKIAYRSHMHPIIIGILAFQMMQSRAMDYLVDFNNIGLGYLGKIISDYLPFFEFYIFVILMLFMEGLVIQMYKFIKRVLFKEQV